MINETYVHWNLSANTPDPTQVAFHSGAFVCQAYKLVSLNLSSWSLHFVLLVEHVAILCITRCWLLYVFDGSDGNAEILDHGNGRSWRNGRSFVDRLANRALTRRWTCLDSVEEPTASGKEPAKFSVLLNKLIWHTLCFRCEIWRRVLKLIKIVMLRWSFG